MTLKSILKTTLLASTFVGLTGIGSAFATNPEPALAHVNIVGAIAITETQELNFASIVPPPTDPDAITIAPGGDSRSHSGGAVLLGSSTRGLFNFDGENGAAFTITLTPGSCTGTGLTLSALTHNSDGTLDDTGTGVGGTLTVAATAAADPGAKTCSYDVAANYS